MSLPSRLSAEAPIAPSAKRCWTKLRATASCRAIAALRVAKSGRRFIIEDGVVWELIDREGMRHGQAATFLSWRDV